MARTKIKYTIATTFLTLDGANAATINGIPNKIPTVPSKYKTSPSTSRNPLAIPRMAEVTPALAGFWSVVVFGSPLPKNYARRRTDMERPLTIPRHKLAGAWGQTRQANPCVAIANSGIFKILSDRLLNLLRSPP